MGAFLQLTELNLHHQAKKRNNQLGLALSALQKLIQANFQADELPFLAEPFGCGWHSFVGVYRDDWIQC